jgi:triosephosphate isomerase
MRKPLIAANWKMYKTPQQAADFVQAFLPLVSKNTKTEVVLFPPAIDLAATLQHLVGSHVGVGAQNMHYAEEGAFTGEISASMVTAIGANYILIGHSERRQYCHETDEIVNKKLHTALKHGLIPIVCVGENLDERNENRTEAILERHTHAALKGITPEAAASIVIAYEPVWAIGTGKTATPEMAATAHRYIRGEVRHLLGDGVAHSMRILYGGSVKPENAKELCAQEEIDGALVGGASLDPVSFEKIIAAS